MSTSAIDPCHPKVDDIKGQLAEEAGGRVAGFGHGVIEDVIGGLGGWVPRSVPPLQTKMAVSPRAIVPLKVGIPLCLVPEAPKRRRPKVHHLKVSVTISTEKG